LVHRPVTAGVAVVGGELGSSLYRLLDREDKADWSSLRWRISLRAGRSCRQRWLNSCSPIELAEDWINESGDDYPAVASLSLHYGAPEPTPGLRTSPRL
jgi:hypothetical protein